MTDNGYHAGNTIIGTALTSAEAGEKVHVRLGAVNGHDALVSQVPRSEQAAEAATKLLSSLEAWERVDAAHRAKTPQRFVHALEQLTTREDFAFTTFPNEGNDEMIVLGPIPFYTLCAHHIVPFFGKAYVGYIPESTIAGLSKFARAVKWCAKGFWVQEDLTTEIATMIEDNLRPRGVAVILEAEHMCMAMRGVETAGVITTTAKMTGVFGDHNRTAKAEFLETVRRRGSVT